MRDGTWKLIHSPEGEPELYLLDDDPGERRNLARDETAAVDRYRSSIAAWLGRTPAEPPQMEDDLVETLRALGYVK